MELDAKDLSETFKVFLTRVQKAATKAGERKHDLEDLLLLLPPDSQAKGKLFCGLVDQQVVIRVLKGDWDKWHPKHFGADRWVVLGTFINGAVVWSTNGTAYFGAKLAEFLGLLLAGTVAFFIGHKLEQLVCPLSSSACAHASSLAHMAVAGLSAVATRASDTQFHLSSCSRRSLVGMQQEDAQDKLTKGIASAKTTLTQCEEVVKVFKKLEDELKKVKKRVVEENTTIKVSLRQEKDLEHYLNKLRSEPTDTIARGGLNGTIIALRGSFNSISESAEMLSETVTGIPTAIRPVNISVYAASCARHVREKHPKKAAAVIGGVALAASVLVRAGPELATKLGVDPNSSMAKSFKGAAGAMSGL